MKKIDKDINRRFIKAADDIIERRKAGIVDKGTFCKTLKIHAAVYAQIKSNSINLSVDKALKLGKMFDLSMNWLFLGIGPMYMSKDDWQHDIKRLIRKYESLL